MREAVPDSSDGTLGSEIYIILFPRLEFYSDNNFENGLEFSTGSVFDHSSRIFNFFYWSKSRSMFSKNSGFLEMFVANEKTSKLFS